MEVISLLEYLSDKTHYNINLDELINNLPLSVQQAFISKNSFFLKMHLADVNKLADKNGLVKNINN